MKNFKNNSPCGRFVTSALLHQVDHQRHQTDQNQQRHQTGNTEEDQLSNAIQNKKTDWDLKAFVNNCNKTIWNQYGYCFEIDLEKQYWKLISKINIENLYYAGLILLFKMCIRPLFIHCDWRFRGTIGIFFCIMVYFISLILRTFIDTFELKIKWIKCWIYGLL